MLIKCWYEYIHSLILIKNYTFKDSLKVNEGYKIIKFNVLYECRKAGALYCSISYGSILVERLCGRQYDPYIAYNTSRTALFLDLHVLSPERCTLVRWWVLFIDALMGSSIPRQSHFHPSCIIDADNLYIKHSDHGTKRQFRRIQIIIL